jgi:hypothetical protein
MKAKIIQIITAMLELQGKGYFDISFDCKGNLFQTGIYKGKLNLHKYPLYYKSIDLTSFDAKNRLDEVFNTVEALKPLPAKDTNSVMIIPFRCYRQEFVKGEKAGKWMPILPVIEYGSNATQSMLIDGSGYYIDDPDNDMLYFVDLKEDREPV